MEKNVPAKRNKNPAFLIIVAEFQKQCEQSKSENFDVTVATQNLCFFMFMTENNVIVLKLVLLESTARGNPVKWLKAIATERKQKVPRSLWFKPGGFVEFWLNLFNMLFKGDYGRKTFE